ncbi:MAG: hypothetical protein Fur0041_13470 [Bacteroidia bacterium]
MKKDIIRPDVDDLLVAVARENGKEGVEYNVYLVNLHEVPIKNVLINSRGYGELAGIPRKTSTLRHFFEEISALDYVKIEPIMENTFGLNNEYWISFYIGDQIYDKRYIFLPESIIESNMMTIPLVGAPGVIIR